MDDDTSVRRVCKRRKVDHTFSAAAQLELRRRTAESQLNGRSPYKEYPCSSGAGQEQDEDVAAKSEVSELSDRRGMEMEGEDESTYSETHVEMQANLDTEGCMDQISRAPHLVQDKVFGLLDLHDKVKAAQVCSTWRSAVYRPCHWRKQKVCLNFNHMPVGVLTSLQKRGITQIEIQGGTNAKIKCFFAKFSSFTSLYLRSKVGAEVFLNTLSLSEFSSLTELFLVIKNDEAQVLSFQTSLWRLSHLRSLSVVCDVSSGLVNAIGKELQGLEKLELNSRGKSSGPFSIKGLTGLSRLQTLSLQNAILTDFSEFCMLDAKLKKLDIILCKLDNHHWLHNLSQLHSLEELVLEFCEPSVQDGLEPLNVSLVNLKKFTVCPAHGGAVKSMALMNSLEEVHLGLTSDVDDDAFQKLGEGLTRLKELSLYGWSDITPRGMEHFGHLPALQVLRVDKGSCMSEFLRTLSLKSLNENLCSLRCLHLTCFPSAESQDIENLAQISTLHELSLGDVRGNRCRLWDLQHGAFSLQTLELRNCGVTVESLMPLFGKQTSLRKLVLVGREIEEGSRRSLYAALPNLQVCVLKGWEKSK